MKQRSAHGIQFKYKPIDIIHIGTTGSNINTDCSNPNGNPLYGVIRNERVCCDRKQKQSKSEQNHIIRTTRLLYQLQQHNNKFSKKYKEAYSIVFAQSVTVINLTKPTTQYGFVDTTAVWKQCWYPYLAITIVLTVIGQTESVLNGFCIGMS